MSQCLLVARASLVPLLGGWKLASSLKTSMSDVISFVLFFLSGSFIRSDRKTSIIKRWWVGVGAGEQTILDRVGV